MLRRANFLGVSVMTVGSRYRINEKQVVYQSFDEEIVAINVDPGTYYSLRGAGAELWSWIAKGYDLAAIRCNLQMSLVLALNGTSVQFAASRGEGRFSFHL
jgi:hypothetical protein